MVGMHKETVRRLKRLAEGRPTPYEAARLANPIVRRLPVPGTKGGWNGRALRRVKEMYAIPREDMDLWYCGTVDSEV